MKSPLVSIVIPTYNRSGLVQGAIRSVLDQSFEDLEVVVSDNCSEDDTRDVVEAFSDPRVRYARTARHTSIADSWEFARTQARGSFVMMLSDDDAMVHDAIARFVEAHHRHEADFLFCNLAEYRDRSFIGPQQNTVDCRKFTGTTRTVSRDELLEPLFALRPTFDFHPSAFMFATKLSDQVVRRCGRFFTTNGVEYFAWPLAAVYSKHVAYIDAPLVILGRTFKSWGSALVLTNPGKELIDKMIADVDHDRDWVPLKNFTLVNLMAEGLLLGKRLFPEELEKYPFDEQRYVRKTFKELQHRHRIGVDVHHELDELMTFADKYPSLKAELLLAHGNGTSGKRALVRRVARHLGLHAAWRRMGALRQNRIILRGEVQDGFTASGDHFGFEDAPGCAAFISRVTAPALSAVAALTPSWQAPSTTGLATTKFGDSVKESR